MLRIYFMQQWYALSDPAMEDALYEIESMRRFARLELSDDALPDETTILKFRHLLERHGLVVCQDSCPRTQPVFSNAWRSGLAGLSQTAPGRVQLRGAPDQRSGFLARACS